MRRKDRRAIIFLFISFFLFASFSLHLSRDVFPGKEIRPAILRNRSKNLHLNFAIKEHHRNRHVSSLRKPPLPPDSILLPDWEVLLVLSPWSPFSSDAGDGYYCLFQNNATSPAKPAGILPFSNRITFKCGLPNSVRRLRPFFQPILTKSQEYWAGNRSESPELFRWGFLAYESLSTENDVILFVKGVNHRQGVNRSPTQLRCVFGDDVHNGNVKTDVTSSSQEVFRCRHPDGTALRRLFRGGNEKIKVSIEAVEGKKTIAVAPSVAYYEPSRKLVDKGKKSLLCACTMVYNVAKFLKEWVAYHSKIGVETFLLYDNGSDDGLEEVVKELLEEYNVTTFLWPWPKTQEAGFSHCAIYARDSCTWMMYIDVDEFVFSPTWLNSSYPTTHMLRTILPKAPLTPLSLSSSSSSSLIASLPTQRPIGQIMIRCFEFGPSNQRSHPIKGVTQGYTCRRRIEQRHKSIVLLDAIDASLLNVIHHFQLKEGYRRKRLSMQEGVVNHYKYQAWSEFKTKFRRRVSAYVVDWREEVNPMSKDRTPGLGFEPIEPKGWGNKFCEVNDTMLKDVTQRWFGSDSPTGYRMSEEWLGGVEHQSYLF